MNVPELRRLVLGLRAPLEYPPEAFLGANIALSGVIAALSIAKSPTPVLGIVVAFFASFGVFYAIELWRVHRWPDLVMRAGSTPARYARRFAFVLSLITTVMVAGASSLFLI